MAGFWEVYTFGGGDYLYSIFNGIAALTKSAGYVNIIAITAMLGLTWAMLQSSFGGGYKASATWIISFMLFYNVMFLPKSTVLINDPLNQDKKYDAVENVPFALAAFASLTSQIGKSMTESMETAFSKADYLPYHKHGMLFGSKLVSMTTTMKIVDEDFAASINSFMKQCVFYDLLLHRYSLNDLKNTDNIWTFLTGDGRPAKARSFEIISSGNRAIFTCEDGVTEINKNWEAQISKLTKPLAKGFLENLPVSYKSITTAAQSASDLIKQNMLINSIDRAASEFSNAGMNGANAYATVKASMQTKAAMNASKRQAEEWVPILRIVFEALFYGAFPLVFLMFLLPIGPQVAQGYFTTFVWLQSWGPLYAILNMVMSGYADMKTRAISHGSLSIVSQSGIAVVQQDVAEIAGYMVWFIPFIAAGIAKGTSTITGLSASMLAIPQSAANSAANEIASGNISLGNVNLDNASYGNLSGNKINDSAFFDSARVQAINQTGGQTTINPDGKAVYDQTGSVSRVPNVQLSNNDTLSQSLMESASVNEAMGHNMARQASEAKSIANDQLAQAMTSHSINENHGVRFNEHTSSEVREAYSRIELEAKELSRQKGIDSGTAFNMMANGNLGYGISTGSKGLNGNASVGIGGSIDSKSSTNYSDAEKIGRTNQLSNDLNIVKSAVQDRSLDLSNSHGESLNESFNHHYSEAKRLEDQSRVHYDISRSYSQQAQLTSSQSTSFSQDKIPEFVEFAKASIGNNGLPLGESALSILQSDPVQTQILKDQFMKSDPSHGFEQHVIKQDLKSQYSSNLSLMPSDVGSFNATQSQVRYSAAVGDRHINNDSLKSDVSEAIKDRKEQIHNTRIDDRGVGAEIEDKLKDGALMTRVKSIKSLFGEDEKKSNFNNGEDEK